MNINMTGIIYIMPFMPGIWDCDILAWLLIRMVRMVEAVISRVNRLT